MGDQERQKRRANIAANYRAFKSRIRTERITTQADQEKVEQAIPEFSSWLQSRLLQVFGFVINLHTIFLMMDGDAKNDLPVDHFCGRPMLGTLFILWPYLGSFRLGN